MLALLKAGKLRNPYPDTVQNGSALEELRDGLLASFFLSTSLWQLLLTTGSHCSNRACLGLHWCCSLLSFQIRTQGYIGPSLSKQKAGIAPGPALKLSVSILPILSCGHSLHRKLLSSSQQILITFFPSFLHFISCKCNDKRQIYPHYPSTE